MKIPNLFTAAILAISCSQNPKKEIRKDNPEKIPTFLLYGALPPVGYTEEGDSVTTKKFGFNLKRVADCDVTEEITDSADRNNAKANRIMQAKFGKDWKQKFEQKYKLKVAIPGI